MTREEAINTVRNIYQTDKEKEALGILIPELAESEDERIRKALVWHLKADVDFVSNGVTKAECLAWLEKQKVKERQDRMMPVYNDLDSFESALEKAWKSYNESGARTVDSCEDDYVECAHAKGFREGYLFGVEMNNGELGALLTETYKSGVRDGQKQKEQTVDIDKLRRDIYQSGYNDGYQHGKEDTQKEQKPSIFPPGLGEVHWNPIPSGKDVHKWNLPEDFEEAVYKVANFISPFDSQEELRKVSHLFAEQLLSLAKKELDKPAEWSKEDEEKLERVDDLLWMLDDYLGDDCSICEERTARLRDEIQKELCPWLKSLRPQKLDVSKLENFDPVEVLHRIKKEWPVAWGKAVGKQEWDEFDEDCLKRAIWYVENPAPSVVKDTNLALWLKSLPERKNLPPKQEWNKEDESCWNLIWDILDGPFTASKEGFKKAAAWFLKNCPKGTKSLRPSWKPSEVCYGPTGDPDPAGVWKPSDEQMKALLNAEGFLRAGLQHDSAKTIANLYEQLKKL